MSIDRSIPTAEALAEESYLRRVHPSDWRNPVPKASYDLVILGGGPCGLAAAATAVGMGRSVALVERNRIGGNSLNVGSVPSKAIVRSGGAMAAVRDGAEYGLARIDDPVADFEAVMARMRGIRTRIAEYHSVERLQSCGIDVFFGAGRFVGKKTLLVDTQPLRFKKALIATGARPRPSDIPGLEQVGYLTSTTIFDLLRLPKRLAIIGGGPLGCEMAQALARMGAQVTILQNEPKFLPHEERDAAELLSRALSRDGVETRLNTTVVGARLQGGEKWVDTVSNGVKFSLAADQIMLSVGRVPNIEDLGLEAAAIDFGAAQGIHVDDYLRTSNANVYSAGDVCMQHKFTNVAQASAQIAVLNAFRLKRRRQSHLLIPWCTYCDPQVAHIGLHVRQARRRAIAVRSVTIMMQDVDRAITDGQDEGFVKIHVRRGSDEILGASIVAAQAGEMINELSVIMSAGIGMRQLAGILHTYPAQSDAIRLAAVAFMRG
ncbi:MAG TPA: mercuric reductase [Steroidobacteraceae bacterium]|nr:mercuric reductase [Steroidobacteraceae bacterium]